MYIAFISLLFGFLIGYLAQRSRMCFIGGMRDYVLVRDTSLLKGLASFLVTAAVLFPLAQALGGDTPGYPWYARMKSAASIDIARDYYVFAACVIPDDVLLAIKTTTEQHVHGLALPGGLVVSYIALTTVACGLGIGYLSTLANGCPLRQHVLAASGDRSARVYLMGFYVGALVFNYFIYPYLGKFLQ
jgi:hypothetical protein